MAVDRKYGQVEVPGIDKEEPIFILRAQDLFAVPAIIAYRSLVAGLGRHEDKHLDGLRLAIRQFLNWTGTKKYPDT